jgi:hypothetical protein
MVNYLDGKIYKIVCNVSGQVYYGSTAETTLAKRLAHHRSDYKQYLGGKRNFVSSFKIFDNNDYYMVLVEKFPCNDKMELHARERFFIEENECVNKNIPLRTRKEYRIVNEDKIKQYQHCYKLDNKEKLKKYLYDNKEKIKLQRHNYYNDNKESINQYQKQYYKNKKSNNYN